jgi:hypothetical protein
MRIAALLVILFGAVERTVALLLRAGFFGALEIHNEFTTAPTLAIFGERAVHVDHRTRTYKSLIFFNASIAPPVCLRQAANPRRPSDASELSIAEKHGFASSRGIHSGRDFEYRC